MVKAVIETGAIGENKMVETEYLVISGYISFYLLVIFIGGLLSMPMVDSPSTEDISVFDGIDAFVSNPFQNTNSVTTILFFIFLISPMVITASMIGLNYVRGRS